MAKRPKKKPRKRFDRRRAEGAVRDLLEAMGYDPGHPDLVETPARVARAWSERLLDGRGREPSEAFEETLATTSESSVIACRIPFMSMCPHHLLPLLGEAHLAFAPRGKVVGFGRLPALVDLLAHRLVLQEELAQALADALLEGVEAKAAVAVIEARHLCVAITDLARANTTFRSTAVAGDRERAAGLMAEIDAALRPPAAEPPR